MTVLAVCILLYLPHVYLTWEINMAVFWPYQYSELFVLPGTADFGFRF